MPTIRNVSTIKATLLKPSLTSFFDVEVGIPPGLMSWLGIRKDRLNIMCSEVDLPGSQVITHDINNDFTGVREKHAYRRVFEEQTNLTFYVDAGDYIPIRFFERWMEYISSGVGDRYPPQSLKRNDHFYRMRYPDGQDGYTSQQGLKVTKFERDHGQSYKSLEYQFIKSYPLSITSMPVSYNASDVLKCTVAMTYIRYVVNHDWPESVGFSLPGFDLFNQSSFNTGGFTGIAANLVDAAVDRATGSDLLGDIAGGAVRGGVRGALRGAARNLF